MAGSLDLIDLCYESGWTDGLPVVPPTEDRVEAMLGSWAPHADLAVAALPPSGGIATLEKIAANAVMAGCRPEYLPVVVAAIKAVAQPGFDLDRVMTTASSQSPVVLVGGPVAAELELSGGWEVLGSSARANATIGRAVQLSLRNIASHTAGGLAHATLGHSGKYSYCLTENRESSPWPTWEPAQLRGTGSSWVSVYPAEAPLCITDMGHEDPTDVMRTLGECMRLPGTYNAYFRQDIWVVMSPQHAATFARQGWSRADVREALFAELHLPADRLRGRGLYGYLDVTMPATWLADDDPVSLVESPESIVLLVAGGEFGGYTAALFGRGRTVTMAVENDITRCADSERVGA